MRFLILLFACVMAAMADEEASQKLLQEGNDAFTLKMFKAVTTKKPGESVVMSAFSVLTPLAQLSLAAEGESHDELLRAIGVSNDNQTREIFTSVGKNLKAIQGVELKTASKVYIPIGYELDDTFAAASKSVFGSEVQNIDFVKNTDAAKEINIWVEDQTNKRIKDLVDPDSLNGQTRAVLVNAIYFKGLWKSQFKKEATSNRDFRVTTEKTVQVPTMYQKAEFRYGEDDGLAATLLELPYKGDEASMLLILPNKVDGLPELQEKLQNPENLARAYKNMYNVEVEVYLPKFKIETTTNLKEVLQEIGVKKIFDVSDSKLTHLLKTKEQLYVSDAIQKAFIEVNEEGAEAAAANAGNYGSSLNPPPKKTFKADHPCVFHLKAIENVLFSGVLVSL